MKNLIIIISLFLGIFTRPAFALEKFVTIDTIPPDQNIIIGQTFPVNVVLETGNINTTFYYLFYGGLEGETSYIQTRGEDGPILSFTDDPYDWENIPTFTTDESGNGYLQSNYAYINPNTPSGNYSLYVKLFFPDYSTDNRFVSDSKLITVVSYSSLTPTPIPTNTPIPTSTPTPTPTPTSTPTSTQTSNNSVPTLTPTPTVNMSIFGVTTDSTASATPTEDNSLISAEASSSTIIETGSNPPQTEKSNSPKKYNTIPLIFLGIGVLLLAIPSIFLKIKQK